MDSHSFNNIPNVSSSQNDLDPEAQHLADLQRHLVQQSPMQPAHHDSSATPNSFPAEGSATPKQNSSNQSTTNSTSSPPDDKSKTPVKSTPLAEPQTPSTVMTGGLFSVPPGTPRTPMSVDMQIVPQLQNIVSTVNLGCKLDLKKIALQARNAEYNPKRFAAVIMRIREPRTTALIFSSGKMVCTGAKSEEMSRLAARKYARIVQKLGFEVCVFSFCLYFVFDSLTFVGKIFRFQNPKHGGQLRCQVSHSSRGISANTQPILQLRAGTVSWPHLSYGQAENCFIDFRLWKSCPNR